MNLSSVLLDLVKLNVLQRKARRRMQHLHCLVPMGSCCIKEVE